MSKQSTTSPVVEKSVGEDYSVFLVKVFIAAVAMLAIGVVAHDHLHVIFH